MKITNSLSCLLILPVLALASESAFAQAEFVEIDAILHFNENDIESECYVFVEEEAPYSHINGDCRSYRNYGEGQEDLIGFTEVYNAPLGIFPRSADYSTRYYALYWGSSDPNSVYCAKLGSETGAGLRVIFGHYDDSSQNLELPAATGCPPTPQPPTNLEVNWGGFSCHNCDCTDWEVHHSATNASSYTLEHSSSSNGPWFGSSATPYNNASTHTPTAGRWYRVKASNGAGSTYGSATFKFSQCDYCGGGGEEP